MHEMPNSGDPQQSTNSNTRQDMIPSKGPNRHDNSLLATVTLAIEPEFTRFRSRNLTV
jgi:hypothetical protein